MLVYLHNRDANQCSVHIGNFIFLIQQRGEC